MTRYSKLSFIVLAVLLAGIGLLVVWPWADAVQDSRFGYVPNPRGTADFLATLENPELSQAAPHLFGANADRQDVFLYRSLTKAYKEKYDKEWVVGKQGIGDCVSWGFAHAVSIHLAVQYELKKTGEWREGATEPIYGGSRVEARGRSRGGYSDGSYGGAAAKWLRDYGVLFRQNYPEFGVDLSTYSSSRAKDWGNYGCGGKDDGGRLDAEAKKHPCLDVALVTNFEEAAAAIANGYPVAVCSGQGFSSTRDSDGFCRASGSWAHCMCFIGVRYGAREGLLCLNSWGPRYFSGPKYPSDQPDGSFWVEKATANRMLSGRDSFAVSGMVGFPRNDLNHGDWVRVEPRRRDAAEYSYALAP